jgi:penicillin-binding protein 1A
VVLSGTGTSGFVPGLYTAGKTGTTQDYRDAWFVGDAGPDIIAVWVGNDNDTPMRRVYGGTVPASVFHEIAVGIK